MKISRQNILKINEEKSLLEMYRDREQNATTFSGQWERTRLGRICNVEIRYQVCGMNKFGYGNPFGLISSDFIP